MSPAAIPVSVHAISIAGQDLESEIDEALAWMSAEEREKHRRFHFDRHRREFALSRFVLRGILGELAGCDPAKLSFRQQADGKPYLRGSEAPAFNLTHTDDFVALITGPPGSSLGVDAEPLDREFDANLLSHVFGEDERQRIAEARDEAKLPVSYWAAKEAYLKQIGTGLSVEPRRLSLAPQRTGGVGVLLDGRLDSGCFLRFATIGKHRLCAALQAPALPSLHVYRQKTWRQEDGLWSPSPACGTKPSDEPGRD